MARCDRQLVQVIHPPDIQAHRAERTFILVDAVACTLQDQGIDALAAILPACAG
jgi:hypothetical protein